MVLSLCSALNVNVVRNSNERGQTKRVLHVCSECQGDGKAPLCHDGLKPMLLATQPELRIVASSECQSDEKFKQTQVNGGTFSREPTLNVKVMEI